MADIKLEHVAKVYPNGVRAVDDFNMEIADKEFIVFVGPSGCGKSTTLRMIAGLEDVSEGEISIDGRVVNDAEPKDRDIAMVFQNYALYPHMTVYDNMAFGLRLRKVPVPVKEENGKPVLTVDLAPKKKCEQKIAELKKYLNYYRKHKDAENAARIEGDIAAEQEKYKNILAALEEDKKTYEKYTAARKTYLNALKAYKAAGESAKATLESAEKILDENKGRLVQLYRYEHYDKAEINRRIMEAAEILGITDYLKRKPKAMSGGQRQRVALGRCMVREPKVFLLDEPLSNLDAKLRASMRVEISKLHNKLQTTFIYVTHDQIEAMTMGTRIVVMKDGVIQQIDTPTNLYNHPCNKFVAGFIGTPQMNFYKGSLEKKEGGVAVKLDGTDVDALVPASTFDGLDEAYLNGEKKVIFGVRSEHLSIEKEKASPLCAKAVLSYVEELGQNSQLYVDFDLNSEETIDESSTRGIIKAEPQCPFKRGDVIDVYFDLKHLFIFDAETEVALKK